MEVFSSFVEILYNLRDSQKGIFFLEGEKRTEQLSYNQLFRSSELVLGKLQERGIKAKDELVFQLENNREFIITFWACMMGGIIPVPVTPAINAESRLKLRNVWKVLKHPHLVCNRETLSRLNEKIASDLSAIEDFTQSHILIEDLIKSEIKGKALPSQLSDIALIQFSSGSTGEPKGVVLTHENLITNINAIIEGAGLKKNDSTLGWMPLTHDMGLIGFHLTPLVKGIDQYLMPTSLFVRRPALWLQKANEYKATFLASPNFGYKHFLSFYDPAQIKDWDLSYVRRILNGAEPISVSLCETFMNTLSSIGLHKKAMFPVYGMAEAGLAVAFPPVDSEFKAVFLDRAHINFGEKIKEVERSGKSLDFMIVGTPVNNCEVRICDENNQYLEDRTVGFIQIKGKNVTKGYYNNPVATESLISKDGWLNTGDLGFLHKGALVITGRAKDVIFFNGQNFYAHDIERVAEELEEVEHGKIVAYGTTNEKLQKEEVLVFVQHRGKPEQFIETAIRLKAYLSQKIALEVTHILPVNNIPKTTSGKIQRYKLSEQYRNGNFKDVIQVLKRLEHKRFSSKEHVASANEIEEKLVKMWEKILHVKGIGTNDNFFELGGHSLKAALLTSQIHQEFNVELNIREIFKAPTIQGMAKYISSGKSSVFSEIEVVSDRNYYPVSSAQKRLFILDKLEDANTAYNITSAIAIKGPLNYAKLESAFKKLIERHEIFRTSFTTKQDGPVQVVYPSVPFLLEYFENANLPSILQKFIRPFNLSKGPLLRAAVVKRESDHLLLFDVHHIIADGTSMGIIIDEFSSLYEGAELSPVQLHYKDFAVWQQKFFKTKLFQAQEQYWLEKFSGELPVLNLPTDAVRPIVQDHKGAIFSAEIDPGLTAQLKALAAETGTTLYMVMLAAYNVLLSRYSGQDDIIVGTAVAGRMHAQVQSMVGVFINMLSMRNFPAGDKSFRTFLIEVGNNAIDAFANHDFPIENLVEELNIKRDLSRNPLFDTVLIFQNMEVGDLKIQGLETQRLSIDTGAAKFDLGLEITEKDSGLEIKVEYATSLFKEDTIRRLLEHFQNILIGISQDALMQIKNIKLLSENEKQVLLHDFNTSPAGGVNEKETITALFERRVQEFPQQVIKCGEEQITYEQLNKRANQLAAYLRMKGAAPEKVVGLLVERDIDMMVSLWGILKSGTAYLPIDPAYPPDRINYMLKDCGADILVTSKDLRNKFAFTGITVDISDPELEQKDTQNLEIVNQPEHLAYIIYTSGSTGKPKGVMIEHRNVLSFYPALEKNYGFKSTDSILALTTVSFDISVLELICSVLLGMKIVIASDEAIGDPKQLIDLLQEHDISVLQTTPSRLQLILEAGKEDAFKNVTKLLIGGEAMPKALYERVLKMKNLAAYNVYGPTEDTVWTTSCKIENGFSIIGKPNCNEEIYIVDAYNGLQPIGVPGEICIYSKGLARGYFNAPGLTHEKFIKNPFRKGERMYRTGDLGRWLPDGNIEYIGRIDHQVKIRGYRIELGEIEGQLYTNPAVKKAVVIDHEDETGFKYLCAYVVLSDGGDITELRDQLKKVLPEYMVPSHIVKLDQIPLTPNGKVNRKKLPLPSSVLTSKGYIAPKGQIEEQLAEIWKKILVLDQVGAEDNFFEIGGHSLKGTILVSQIQKKMNVEVPLRTVFNNPTIRSLSEFIAGQGKSAFEHIEPVKKAISYPASPAQRRLFVLAQFDDSSTSYNMPGTFIIKGPLDVEKLKQAFRLLLERHEILRTSFEMLEDETVQVVHDKVQLPFQFIESTEAEANDLIRQLIKPFNLSQSPLMRVAVIKLGEEHHLLLCDMHHIISDAYSTEILVREFLQLYEEKSLPVQKLQYKDYAVWQNWFLQSDSLKQQQKYWLDQFAEEAPVLDLPTDFKRPAIQNFEGASFSAELDNEELKKLKALSKDTGATLFMIMLAAYNLLLSKYSRQQDIVVGTPVAGRQHPDLQDMIGMFVNTLALRSYPENKKTFRQYLAELRELTLNVYENQDYPFEELVEKLNVQRDMSRNPLFDTMFAYQDSSTMGELRSGETRFNRYLSDTGISKFDISLDVVEYSDRMMLLYEYSVHLFRRETIERMQCHFKNVINSVLENPDIALGKISLLNREERDQLLSQVNNTEGVFPEDITAIDLFEAQALKTPYKTALTFPAVDSVAECNLTYHELNEKAGFLASLLINKGIQKEELIGVMMDRSPEMFISVLGIWKAGAAYVPIDPEYPQDRIEHMLSDSRAHILITNDRLKDKVAVKGETIVIAADMRQPGITAPSAGRRGENLAYVIYTSGSTGKPKGVMIEHKSLVNIGEAWKKEYKFNEIEVKTLQLASFSFDVFVGDILRTLTTGGQLVVCPTEYKLDLPSLLGIIEQYEISFFESTPGLIIPLMEYAWEQQAPLSSLKLLVLGSDTCSRENYRTLRQQYGNRFRIINSYGVTEATIDSSYFEGDLEAGGGALPIGKPFQNTQFYILEEEELQPIGIPGELCIGGIGVARAYHNRSDLDEEKFTADPFIKGNRIYRTGDLARFLPDGNVEFLGRKDTQVKIRGYRIELGEIENRLIALTEMKEVVVIDREDKTESKYLCAYYTGADWEEKELRSLLSKELPEYMIPAHFVKMDHLPLTNNGKINRRALPEPLSLSVISEDYKMPASREQEVLAETWKEVLGIKQVSVDANFFSLGGDSIKAIQVVSRLKKYGFKLDVKDLFQQLTIENIAPYLKHEQRKIEQGPVEGEVTLTPIQFSFFEEQLAEPQFYTQGVVLFLKERFEHGFLENSLHRLTEHHDVLRMRFIKDGGRIKQFNFGLEGKHYDLVVTEITGGDGKDTINEKSREIQRKLDLEKGPLLKAVLFKAAEGDHLLLVIHHLVVDGVSWRILLEDFMTTYKSAASNLPPALLPKTTSYKDWAGRLLKYANSENFLNEMGFWKKLETTGAMKLPKDNAIAVNLYRHSKSASFKLSKDETEQLLKETNHAYNTEVNDLLLSALAMGVKEWAGTEKVLINLEGHGREDLFEDIDITRTVGWFTSMYPVLLEVENEISGSIKTTKETLRKIPNKGIGYGILKYLTDNEFKQGIQLSLQPEISFNYLGQFDEQADSDFEVKPLSLVDTVSPDNQRSCSIDINGMVMKGELIMEFTYSAEEYRDQTMNSLLNAYKTQLQQIITHCVNKEETEITPSDLSYSDIDLEELDNIFG